MSNLSTTATGTASSRPAMTWGRGAAMVASEVRSVAGRPSDTAKASGQEPASRTHRLTCTS